MNATFTYLSASITITDEKDFKLIGYMLDSHYFLKKFMLESFNRKDSEKITYDLDDDEYDDFIKIMKVVSESKDYLYDKYLAEPYTIICNFYCINGYEKNYITLSPKQALQLEVKLNKTNKRREWIELGNILYKWRIDSNLYIMEESHVYDVSYEQFKWINKNLQA